MRGKIEIAGKNSREKRRAIWILTERRDEAGKGREGRGEQGRRQGGRKGGQGQGQGRDV